jgi:hypothetical protein
MKGNTRSVYWVPILHNQADLGSLSEPVRRHFIQRVGRGRWEEHVRSIEQLWRQIGTAIAGLQLDYPRTRLYQDGLPVCGREEDIVRDLAAAGSTNHQLLLDLVGKGCRLMGTESPELLVEEYNLTRTLLQGQPPAGAAAGPVPARAMLDRRDAFIARRIAETLQPSETGLVFLGLLHSLEGRLPADVRLVRLDLSSSSAAAPPAQRDARQSGSPSDAAPIPCPRNPSQ